MLFGATSSFAQSTTRTTNTEDLQKQKKAEQVVIRAMRIFGQTLDFEDVYRATYVRDKKFRENIADAYLKDDVIELFKIIDKNSVKVYSKVLNNMFWAFLFSRIDDEGKEWKRLQREISLKLSRRQRALYKRLLKATEENDDAQNTDKLTKVEANEILPMCNIALNIFRKHFAKRVRRTAQNKVEIYSTEKITNFANKNPDIYKDPFGITIKVNDVEMNILFTVVEEAGVMKIFSIRAIND